MNVLASLFGSTVPHKLALGCAFGCALVLAAPAGALDVPFDNGTVIDSSTNRGFSTFLADLDGDGDLDFLSAVSTPTNTVSWFVNPGNGIGPFTEHTIATGFTGATSVHAGDVDGDGDLDVVAVAFDLGDIVVYINGNGAGTSWTTVSVDLSAAGARRAMFADIDGDGDLDIAAAVNGTGTKDVCWYENTAGDGSTWAFHGIDATMNGARGLDVADIDADGHLDLAVAAEFDDKVTIYRNTLGTGLTWVEKDISTALFDGGSNVVIVDVDGDGKLDVAGVAETASNGVWWRNPGGDAMGAWTETFISPSIGGAYALAAADFDFDGDIDFVTGGRSTQRTDWWENTAGNGSAWTQHLIETSTGPARSVATGDINGDGWIDTIMNTDGRLEWWRNESIHRNSPFLQTRNVDLAAAGAFDLEAADMDRDGDLDLVGSAQTADQIMLYRNTSGDGTAFTPVPVATGFDGARAIELGDVDGDGHPDVVGAAQNAGDLIWWRNVGGTGTTFTATTIDASFAGARDVKLADIDGDGDLDVAAAGFDADELAFYRNANGDGSLWNKITALSFFNEASSVDAGDIDGDGDIDLIGASFANDTLAWARNSTGDGSSWSEQLIVNSFDGASAVRLADVDSDGDLDVVAVAELGDEVAWFENASPGNGSVWTFHSIATGIDGARGVAVADLDQDGAIDVVATQGNGAGRVIGYLNLLGNGSAWSTVSIDNAFAGAALVSVADVDGDGRPDVLAGAATDGDFKWWRNGGGQAALPTVNSSPAALGNSVTDDLLRIGVRNNGRAGEANAELATLELRFEDGSGIALDSAQANGIIENLYLYLDTGDATWSPADTLVQTDATLTLVSGVHTMVLADGDANLSVAVGTTKTYFVVVQTTANYTTQPFGAFRMVHLTESSSRVEDRPNDTPLRLEYQPNVGSNVLQVNPSVSFSDIQLLSVSDSPDPVAAGTQLTYTVAVMNGGSSPADNVTVTSTLPSGVAFSSTIGCLNDPSGNPICNLGTVGAGATVTFDLIVTVGASTTGTLSYSASVSSTTPDTNPANNSGAASTTVERIGDLSLDLIDLPPGSYAPGAVHHDTIVVTNSGPSDLTGSLLNDTFPAALTGVAWSCTATAGSTCASGTGNIVNSPVSLRAGGVATYRVRGTVAPGTTANLSNTATVTDPNDPNATDNTDTVVSVWGNPIFVDGFETGNVSRWQ